MEGDATTGANVACGTGRKEDVCQVLKPTRGSVVDMNELQAVDSEKIVVFEGYIQALVGGVFLMVLLLALLVAEQSPYIRLGVAGILIFILWGGWIYWSRRNSPLLTLTPTGFQVGDMQQGKRVIPWEDVANIQFVGTPGCHGITFTLTESALIPSFNSDSRTKVREASHQISLVFWKVRAPLRQDSLQDSIIAHWQGGVPRNVV